MQIAQIPMDQIFSDSVFNCRGAIIPYEVESLITSIRDKGLMQPIVVRPYNHPPHQYKIVVGHRRHAACKLLKMTEIPANIKEMTEGEARALNLIENLERKDLNMLQEALAIKWFREAGLQLREVAKEVGKSTGWVSTRYLILDLEPDIQLEIAAGLLKQDQIKMLHEIPSRQGRIEAVKRIKEAKARGEDQGLFTPPKPKKAVMDDMREKTARNMREIFEILDLIYNEVGPNIATRALAWAGGAISTDEFFTSLKEEYPDFTGVKTNDEPG